MTSDDPRPRDSGLETSLQRALEIGEVMKRVDHLQGTLNLLILRTLLRGKMHGWAIAQRLDQISESVLTIREGSLYTALHRLEGNGWIACEWAQSENNRRSKYYRLTPAGRTQFRREQEHWTILTKAVARILRDA